MPREIRNRIIREATPDEKQRHAAIRQQVEGELPELKQWARAAAERCRDRVAIGTVLTAQEAEVLKAIDHYAAEHCLPGRSAVVREALAELLGVELARR